MCIYRRTFVVIFLRESGRRILLLFVLFPKTEGVFFVFKGLHF